MNIVHVLAAAGVMLCATASVAFAQAGPEEQVFAEAGTPKAVPVAAIATVPAATPKNAFGARSLSECPKETHPQAVDPWKVECVAEFSAVPFPRAPVDYNSKDPAQVAALTEHGHRLVEQLDQYGVCSEDTPLPRTSACALIVYTVDPLYRQTGGPLSEASYIGPWTHIIVVYRMTHPADIRDTTVWTVKSNFLEGWYGPGTMNALWHLTAPQRMGERCKERGGTYGGTTVAKAGVVNGSCVGESANPALTPQVIVPCKTAHEFSFFGSDKLVQRLCNAPTIIINSTEMAKIFE